MCRLHDVECSGCCVAWQCVGCHLSELSIICVVEPLMTRQDHLPLSNELFPQRSEPTRVSPVGRLHVYVKKDSCLPNYRGASTINIM